MEVKGDGSVEQKQIFKACEGLIPGTNYDAIRTAIKDVDINTNGTVEVEEFIEVQRHTNSKNF